ncbi:hypothetical protein ABZ793_23585 [Micromonospora sp. NPDC047465]|uniref:hypothetical protein n=1 Tax=Micromonospora sp. NPDC047465 TaxID=3154813 RepID=UPI0033D70B4A
MSLDGYIADDQGGYDRTVPVAGPTLDTEHQLPFDEFLDEVDIVVMGRHCRSPARLVKVTGGVALSSAAHRVLVWLTHGMRPAGHRGADRLQSAAVYQPAPMAG